MGVNIRNKGKSGEYEVINRLQPFFPDRLERQIEQVRHGGSDIKGSHPFVIEIKRVENISLGNKNTWWRQVRKAVEDHSEEIPCVIFRPNRAEWRVLISVEWVGLSGEGWMEISEGDFLRLVTKIFEERKHG